MNIGVVGSRSIKDTSKVEATIKSSPWYRIPAFWPPDKVGIRFVSGGADGVDSCVEEIADDIGIPIDVIEPDWDNWNDGEDGHPALARNTEIVEKSDVVVAVWDGHSNGTRDTIDKALDRSVPIYVEVV